MELDNSNLKAFTHDYITRTMANYNTIYERYLEESKTLKEEDIKDAFEVTQLINSLFGILIMPFESVKALKNGLSERKLKNINKKMEEADREAFADLSKVIQELKKDNLLYNSYNSDYVNGIAEIAFVHRLRNSLAHSGNNGLHFFPIGDLKQEASQIQSVIFCDKEKKEDGGTDKFIAQLSVERLRRVVNSLAEIFGKFEDFADFYDAENYRRTINSMKNDMKKVYEGVFEFDESDLVMIKKDLENNLRIDVIDEKRRRGYTTVCNELEFFSWIFKSNGRYKLVEPKEARERLKKMLSQAL